MNNSYVLLNNVEHQKTRIRTERSAQYGDDVNFSLIFPLEFRNVQSCYPIFIRKDSKTGEFLPIALFGFEERENLFLNESGWDAHYVPLMIRRHPFVIGTQLKSEPGSNAEHVVSIDMNSPRVNETEGEPLFLEHGGVSDYLASITEMLETIRLANEMNAGFIAALLQYDLIEAVTMKIGLDDGSQNELIGYYTINEDKLRELDGEALQKLHAEHYLESIFMIVSSMSSFRTLVEKRNQKLVESKG